MESWSDSKTQHSNIPPLHHSNSLLPMNLSFQLNGKPWQVDCEPQETLAEVLRNTLNLNGTKVSCEVQVCGACTVLIDGAPGQRLHLFGLRSARQKRHHHRGLGKTRRHASSAATSVHR